MRLSVEVPDRLVDISRLPNVQISTLPDGLRLGAAVKMSAAGGHPAVVKHFPALSQSLLLAASAQLRNAASLGGNLLQRTRCPYFRDVAFPCNKRRPGSGCPAIAGIHDSLAVLGASDACIATHPGDFAVALAALDGTLVLEQRDGGTRRVPVGEFYLLPGREPQRETVLRDDELITEIEVPGGALAGNSVYLKLRERTSYAFALVSVAAALDVQNGRIRAARIALGGVAAKPWRVPVAEQTLVDAAPGRAVFERAADALLRDASPLERNAYKVPLARHAVIEALETLSAEKPAP